MNEDEEEKDKENEKLLTNLKSDIKIDPDKINKSLNRV